MGMLGNSAAFAANKDPAVAAALHVPAAKIYAIDVSFSALKDKKELEYLNLQPTTFVLESEAVDRLRTAAGTIIMASPEFQRLLKDHPQGARVWPGQQRGQPRRGREGVLLLSRLDAHALVHEVSVQVSPGGLSVRRHCHGQPRPRQARVRVRTAGHGRVRRKPLLRRVCRVREGNARRCANQDQ